MKKQLNLNELPREIVHSCKVKGNRYIVNHEGKWWFKTDKRELYIVLYCPYCAEKLSDEVE